MAKILRYDQLLQLAVAEGATTPNPGVNGVIAWSTILNTTVEWDGSTWNAVSGGSSQQIIVSATEPSNPTLNQLWIQI